MALQAKTVGSFTILDETGACEVGFKFDDTVEVNEHSTDRLKIPAATVDYVVDFGTVGTAKRVVISPASRVTLKIEDVGNVGFVVDGPTVLSGEVNSLFITTTDVEVIVKVTVAE